MTVAVAGELSILGTRVRVAADTRELLDGLASVYASVPAGPAAREVVVRLRQRGDREALLETPEGALFGRGDSSAAAAAAIGFGLFHQLVGRATEHLVLHAAAVVQGAGAVLIVAPSRVGKTTLAVTRVLAGAGFLSDEAAPIDRATGLIAPLPRSVGIRPGPLADRLRDAVASSPQVEERGGRRKHLVNLVALGVARLAAPARPHHVVFLVPPEPHGSAASAARTREWYLDVDRITEPFVRQLRSAGGVEDVAVASGGLEPTLRLRTTAAARLSLAVDAAARTCDVVVVRLAEGEYANLTYENPTELRELAARDGVLRLARHVENGVGSALLAQGSPGMLIIELAEALGEAHFWELTAGPLEDMSRLVGELR